MSLTSRFTLLSNTGSTDTEPAVLQVMDICILEQADVINRFVEDEKINSVIEFGCSDGNQLRLLSIPGYIGFDVSETAIALCRKLFARDRTSNSAEARTTMVYKPISRYRWMLSIICVEDGMVELLRKRYSGTEKVRHHLLLGQRTSMASNPMSAIMFTSGSTPTFANGNFGHSSRTDILSAATAPRVRSSDFYIYRHDASH